MIKALGSTDSSSNIVAINNYNIVIPLLFSMLDLMMTL
jgi:hypothetical protein